MVITDRNPTPTATEAAAVGPCKTTTPEHLRDSGYARDVQHRLTERWDVVIPAHRVHKRLESR